MSIDSDQVDDEIILVFLNNFSEVPGLLKQFSGSLPLIYRTIASNRIFTSLATNICQQIFDKWENDCKSVAKEVVKCCLDMWLTMKGEDYDLKHFEKVISNLVVEEADVMDYFSDNDERLEFDPETNEILVNPMSNLILEEVEVTDYIHEDED